MIETIEANANSIECRIGIVVSKYNDNITSRLLEGAIAYLRSVGLQEEQIVVVRVPGAWELPIVVDAVLMEKECDGAIALGAVIKGETTHDQHINRAVSNALMEIAMDRGKPIGFGLLTVNSLEQAIHRAGGNVGNKGEEAAAAVIDTLRVLRQMAPTRKIGLQ